MAYELREAETAVTSLVVQPGFTRTERVEATFAETDAPVPGETHSPAFVGRVVAALAGDPNVQARTGTVARVADLAREYEVVDVNGRRPEPFSLDTPAI